MKKLLNIQSKLKCDKAQYNQFGKYSYRSAEDILEALKPLLEAEQCALIITDEIISTNGSNYVQSEATLFDAETGTKIASTKAFAREAKELKGMSDGQITGATSSYARKYALNGLFAIDNTKDLDAPEVTNPTETRKPQAPTAQPKPQVTQPQAQQAQPKINGTISFSEADIDKIRKMMYSAKSLDELKEMWKAYGGWAKQYPELLKIKDERKQILEEFEEVTGKKAGSQIN